MDDRQKHLETILVIVLGMIVIYFAAGSRYILWGAIALGLIGVFIPAIAAKIHWAWMKLAHVLGYVMGKVMLTLVYTLVVLPMSWFAKNKVSVRLKANSDSYFKERNYTYKKEDLENVW
jgi:hypothetical protein